MLNINTLKIIQVRRKPHPHNMREVHRQNKMTTDERHALMRAEVAKKQGEVGGMKDDVPVKPPAGKYRPAKEDYKTGTISKPRARSQKVDRICLRCEKPFRAETKYIRLCSDRCRSHANTFGPDGGAGRQIETGH